MILKHLFHHFDFIIILLIYQEFFENDIVNKRTNETYICLIPKKKNASKVRDFRSISLVASLYKIIAKVLADRLKDILPSTISDCQATFIQGRQILDAILTAAETIEDWKMS
ncbi:MAG: reverse transcriptase domain-containing protein [Sweet potato little leaf phytoplasma]|nr:reverse transcriptase domain-containing protein [Sweet potato little leaf phytoplasma]